MRVFYDLDEIRGQIPAAAVAVGSFDGVHAGHRVILEALKDAARQNGGESVVVTFSPHPRQVLYPDEHNLKLLNSLEEKLFLLERAGIDNVFVVRFTPEFGRIGSEEFARRYLLEGIGAKTIVMGYNHHFGHGRAGDRDYLEALKSEYDFTICQLPRQEVSDRKVSSTVLRELIGSGDLESARKLLTEPYLLIGRRGVGNRLEYDEGLKLFPPAGEYRVCVGDGGMESEGELTILPDGGLELSADTDGVCGERLIVRVI